MAESALWQAVRARHPGAIVTRVIYVEAGFDSFLRLDPIPERRDEALLYDGATIFIPALEDPADIDGIVRTYDALRAPEART